MSQDIQHEGVVVSVSGDVARVRIRQTSACSACHAHGTCMASESTEKIIDCQSDSLLKSGDRVMVTVSRRLGMSAVLLSFVLPFVILFVMLLLLNRYLDSEGMAGTLALCSLLPYYLLLALLRKRMQHRFSFRANKLED
ncbi:MAG: SoxR reducing system RseC family protein [Paludibacter sp.]|nr:SoxR reducing system RseC family protein [Bacteroidales bacterium]MCM1069592.1 SoxR reducing system RseC family protein [Prevotella sp.]MCM1354238.1 SoxR reducing system RseC family protein [Bacteroides sp.]MCM1443023.1 SoxR reducing system RseC family protein [Muribaculum sp.]MCM1482312.1 SoxR reducing system RseC family protein [Paludibacter sp.]